MRPIVLVHGFWVTPRSWENWKTHYEAKGHQVVAPGYPGFEVEVLKADGTVAHGRMLLTTVRDSYLDAE